MTGPQLGFARAVDLALADLDAISSRLPTFFDECWVPAAPNHDRPTRLHPADADPDHVPGPVWDCGLADHRAREGWKRMFRDDRSRSLVVVEGKLKSVADGPATFADCGLLLVAHQEAVDILYAALGIPAPPVPPCRPARLVDAQYCVTLLRQRVTQLQRLWAELSGRDDRLTSAGVDVPNGQRLARQLMGERGHPEGSPFDHIRQARDFACRVVREVGNGKPPATCRQCRRTGSIGRSRKGGLCDACYQRNYRLEARQRQVKVRHAKGA